MFLTVHKEAFLCWKKVSTTCWDIFERESFKLIASYLLKLSFCSVFAFDFCGPFRSSSLGPNEATGKRWHLGMARVLHGRTGHSWLCEHVSSAFKRHVRYYITWKIDYFIVFTKFSFFSIFWISKIVCFKRSLDQKEHNFDIRYHIESQSLKI